MEGEIGRFRRRWFVPVPRVASLAELNARLAEADAAEDARHIAYRAATVGEDFAAERRSCCRCHPSRSIPRRRCGRGWTGMRGSPSASAGIRCPPS